MTPVYDFTRICIGTLTLGAIAIASASSRAETLPTAGARTLNEYGKIGLSFERNQGQTNPAVNFLVRGAGYTLFLTPGEAVFVMPRRKSDSGQTFAHRDEQSVAREEPAVLRMKLVGAKAEPAARGLEKLPGVVHYFIGNEPRKWQTDIPTFGRVQYDSVYEGVDLVYYGNQRQLEYDFVVRPGANHEQIALRFDGASKIEVEAGTGDLLLRVGEGTIRQHKPFVYQEVDGVRREIPSGYVQQDGDRIGISVGAYDVQRPLVIDPVLVYSTYFGGNGDEAGARIAVDSSGHAYFAGQTRSTNFPGDEGGFGGDSDAFVTKLNPTGTGFVYSTYLGGSKGESASGLALHPDGSASVTGTTVSANFPTANALQAALSGPTDAFVTKLSPSGGALVYSTYLGGTGTETGHGLAVSSSGSVYVGGDTSSPNFPTKNPLQGANGTSPDGFVTMLNPAGTALVYSTYLGGNNQDIIRDIALDSAGSAYVVGQTQSTNFPTVNAFQGAIGNDGTDAFVSKLNPAGTALIYSTYLGGNGTDQGQGIAVDTSNSAYVVGGTDSGNFPTTPGVFQSTRKGTSDSFVTKFSASGTALAYSTYLGGTGSDAANGLALDSARNVYVTGVTSSTDFLTMSPFQNSYGGGFQDAYVTKMDGAGKTLIYSTYLGGSNTDLGVAIALDSAGSAYVTGRTSSTNFPATPGAFQNSGTESSAFVAKLSTPTTLVNIATRLSIDTGDNVLIGGFIVTGNVPKRFLARAIGPSLAVAGALANPTLQIYNAANELIGSNDNWQDAPNGQAIIDTQIAPSNDLESAVLGEVVPGAYTAVVSGVDDGTGVGVVEIYDLAQNANSELANISSRGVVKTGDDVMIGGFIVIGPQKRTVIIRAIGPSLPVSGKLADPTLELVNNNGTTLATNDDWRSDQEAEIIATGVPPQEKLESAIVRELSPGLYTAIVRGASDATGVGLVEIYALP